MTKCSKCDNESLHFTGDHGKEELCDDCIIDEMFEKGEAQRLESKKRETSSLEDRVNRPKHYTQHPSGIECIQVTEHMGFCLGNAMKYIWRAGEKGDAIEDLYKAVWYIDREIEKLKKLK